MLRRTALAFACLAAVAAAPARMTPVPETLPPASPAVVARFVENMRDNITLGRLPDGTPMSRETPEERALPILPADVAQRAFDAGTLSGGIEACGGEWRAASFDPLMTALTAGGGLTPKQLGFAALLHDAAREQSRNFPEEACTPEIRRALAASAQPRR